MAPSGWYKYISLSRKLGYKVRLYGAVTYLNDIPEWSQDTGQVPDQELSHSHKFAMQGMTPESVIRIFNPLVSSETRHL